MDDVYSKKEIAELSDKKESLLLKIDLEHKKMGEDWHSLNKQFEELYPFLNIADLCYEIKCIDFHFGEIACEYRGDDNTLSADLFAFNNRLADVSIQDLSCSHLIEIYNFLVKISRDVFGFDCKIIVDDDNYKTNDIIEKIKQLTEKITYESNIRTDEEISALTKAIQKTYVMIDFLLYEDEEREKIRESYNDYLYLQEVSYIVIESFREQISSIDKQLEILSKLCTLDIEARTAQELFQTNGLPAQATNRVQLDITPKISTETLQKVLEIQERQRKKEKRRSTWLKIFSVIKTIIIGIAYVLFGGIGWVIQWTSEAISEYIYENDQKRQKTIKCFYIVICILLAVIMLGAVCVVSKDIWTIVYFSAIGLMIIGWILFGVFYICYGLISFLLKKIRKIESFAKLITFCIVSCNFN